MASQQEIEIEVLRVFQEALNNGKLKDLVNIIKEAPQKFGYSNSTSVTIQTLDDVRNFHYARNELQPKYTELDILNNLLLFYVETKSRSTFHTQTPQDSSNLKFLSLDGRYEYILRPTSTGFDVLDNPNNSAEAEVMGTYNLGIGNRDHTALDIFPYLLWGNSSADPSTFQERVALFGIASKLVNGFGDSTLFNGASIETIYQVFSMAPSGGPYRADWQTLFVNRIDGDETNNIIDGNTGFFDRREIQIIYGFGGDDTIAGLAGADFIDGGQGVDTANYRASPEGIILNLAASVGFNGHASGEFNFQNLPDELYSIENVLGSEKPDLIQGNNESNLLIGFNGNDVLVGGGADDTLNGGSGSDTLLGGSGENDRLVGGDNNDILDGGSGSGDTAVFQNSINDYTLAFLSDESFKIQALTGNEGTDTLIQIERLQFREGIISVSDFLSRFATSGGGGASGGSGGGASGGGGSDPLPPPPPPPDDHGDSRETATPVTSLDGSIVLGNIEVLGDQDFFSFSTQSGTDYGVVVIPANSSVDPQIRVYNQLGQAVAVNADFGGGPSAGVRFTSNGGTYFVEVSAEGATSGAFGLGISLITSGSGGNDPGEQPPPSVIPASTGNGRNPTHLGDDGDDSFIFSSSESRDLFVVLNGGDDLTRTGAGDDWVSGGDGDDEIETRGGDDLISGGEGRDEIDGGEGDDGIAGGDDDDRIEGGDGDDVIAGERGEDTIGGGDDDDVIDGGDGDDDLDGDAGDDGILGGDGDDRIDGGDGDDVVYAGPDDDRVFGERGNDALYGDDGKDVISGGDGNDFISGGRGDDQLDGDGGNDNLIGGSNDDLIRPGAGDDEIHGESGDDTLSYDVMNGGATINMLVGEAFGPQIGFDIFDSIEVIVGTNGDDIIIGDADANTLNGDSGSDIIRGGSGDDLIDGDAGTDTAVFSGNRADYTITLSPNPEFDLQITDNRTNSPDGTDLISSISFLSFADVRIRDEEAISVAPTAVKDNFTASSKTLAVLDVLANDSDPDGNLLSISRILTQPSSGRVFVVDNKIVFDPKEDFNLASDSTVSFSYEISDGTGFRSQATAAIVVEADPNDSGTGGGDTGGGDTGSGVIVIGGSGDQQNASITQLTSGQFVLTWATAPDIEGTFSIIVEAQLFDIAGIPVAQKFRVDTAGNGLAGEPVVTSLANGGFIVIWTSYDSTQDGSGEALKAQIFDSSGSIVGGEFLVNTDTIGGQTSAAVTSLQSGGFVVTWQTSNFDGIAARAIKAQIFNDTGSKVGGEFFVNATATDFPFIFLNPSICELADGRFVITWISGDIFNSDQAGTVYGQIFDPGGQKEGSEFIVNSEAATLIGKVDVAALENGGFVVSWMGGTGADGTRPLKAQIYDGSGGRIGSIIDVNEGGPGFLSDLSLTSLSNGGFLASWIDGGGAVKTQIFDALGQKQGGELVRGGGFSPSAIRSDDTSVALIWSTSSVGRDINLDFILNETPPVISSNGGGDSASVALAEGQLSVAQVNADATQLGSISYSISGGIDAARFTINPVTGTLSFVASPDFEQPGDSNGDNVYEVIVTASDGASFPDIQKLSVGVDDRSVAPQLSAPSGFAGGVGGTTAVFLTSGFQDLHIIDRPGTIALSGPPGGDDIIRFAGAASAYTITRVGSRVEIADGDTRVSIPVSPTGINVAFADGPRTLGIVGGQIRLGSQVVSTTGAPITAPAETDPLPNFADAAVRGRLVVAEGSPVTVSGKIDVFGTGFDNELFVAASGDIAIRGGFTGGMDTVGFDGPASDYTAVRSGSTVFIETNGTKVSIPISPTGTKLLFGSDERLLKVDTATGKILIGTQEIGASPTPLTSNLQTSSIDASDDATVSISPNGGDLMALAPDSFEEMLAFASARSSAGPQRLIGVVEGGSLSDTEANLQLLLSDVSEFDPLGPADMLRLYYATAYTGMYAQAYLALDDDALMGIHQSGSQFGGLAPSPVMLASFDTFVPGG
jgi:Ca2+-binding RTX toxin-like protein